MSIANIVEISSTESLNWKPAPSPLTTVWGESVAPENAWTEYPRPQFTRTKWQNLNGLWQYAITSKTALGPEYDGSILVPFCVESSLSGVGRTFTPNDRLWYRRTFFIPEGWGKDRILLHFGAVDYESVVYINGAIAGTHVGGHDSFSIDVTEFLRVNGENELVVSVTDPTDTDLQPRGKQVLQPRGIWYTAVSGIWQTVWLEPVPREMAITELRVTPDVDRSLIKVAALTNRISGDLDLGIRVVASLNGDVVGSTILRINRESEIPISTLSLWSTQSPTLYSLRAELVKVEITLDENEKLRAFSPRERELFANAKIMSEPLDAVGSYFAMRKVSMSPDETGQLRLMMNDRFEFQHGPLDQGWWPESLLTPPSDEAIIWEIETLKRAGFNLIRKHIKVEPDRYYYHCDRLGMMVWQDMPSGFQRHLHCGPDDHGEPIRSSANQEQHELELRRMIDRLYNHPCIVMWVIHNEGWGQYLSSQLASWVKSLDPGRWVNATSGWVDMGVGDLYDIHTYDVVPAKPECKDGRALVIGEYGGVGWPIEEYLWKNDKNNWGYQTFHTQEEYERATIRCMETLLPMIADGLSAAVYTQTTDVEAEINGLFTYDRKLMKLSQSAISSINHRLRTELVIE